MQIGPSKPFTSGKLLEQCKSYNVCLVPFSCFYFFFFLVCFTLIRAKKITEKEKGVKSFLEQFRNFSVQFSSVTQSCTTLCDPMKYRTKGLPVHHQLPKFTQTHVHCALLFMLSLSSPGHHVKCAYPSCNHTPAPPSIQSLATFLGYCVACLVTQLCPTLCNIMDCSLPDPYDHGLFFFRQEYWSRWLFHPPRNLFIQGQNLGLLCLLHFTH